MPDSGDRLPGPAARASPWRRRGAVRPPKRCCSIGHVVLLLVGVTVGLAVGYGVQLYALDGIRSLSAHAGAAAPATVALPHRRAFLAVTQPDVGREVDDGVLRPCDCTACTLTSGNSGGGGGDDDDSDDEDIYAVADWRSPLQQWTFPEWRPVDQHALEATTQLDDFLRAMKAPRHDQSIFPMQAYQLRRVAGDMSQLRTICAVGLNGGHAAVNWLVAAPSAHLYVFDAGDHAYTALVKDYLDAHFPGRATVVAGVPTYTVPEFKRAHPEVTCDVVHIDGSHHSGDDPLADIENFAALATPRFRRLIVDEAACGPSWCQHTSKAWVRSIQRGLIIESHCTVTYADRKGNDLRTPQQAAAAGMSTTDIMQPFRGYCVGFYKPPGL